APKFTVSAARDMVRKRDFRKDGKKLSSADPLGDVEADRDAKTVNELCDRYLTDHAEPRKRPESLRNDKSMISRIIRPRFGTRKVTAITFDNIDELHRSLKDTPYQANRLAALLTKMFSLASTRWKWRPDNPCKGIERYPEEKRERYLTPDELQRLLRALAEHPYQQSANAIRLLLMTGARRGEVLSATWAEFDLQRGVWTKPSIHVKTEKKHIVPLNAP